MKYIIRRTINNSDEVFLCNAGYFVKDKKRAVAHSIEMANYWIDRLQNMNSPFSRLDICEYHSGICVRTVYQNKETTC